MATEAVGAALGEAGPAFPTVHLTGQQVFRTLLREEGNAARTFVFGPGTVSKLSLSLLHSLPQLIADDTEFWHLNGLGTVVVGAEEGVSPARVRILAIGLLLVGSAPDVELVVEDAGAALHAAGDGVGRPGGGLAIDPLVTFAAPGWRHALGVEPQRNLIRGDAAGIFLADARYNGSLRRHDLEQALDALAVTIMLDILLIPVGAAAGVLAHFMPSAQRIAGLVRRGAELLGIDRAHHADVQGRDHALLERPELDPAEFEPLVEHGDVRLASRDTVHRIRTDDVDTAIFDRAQQRLIAGAVCGRGGFRIVAEYADFRPASPHDFAPACHQLRVDRQRILLVRRIAGVENHAHVVFLPSPLTKKTAGHHAARCLRRNRQIGSGTKPLSFRTKRTTRPNPVSQSIMLRNSAGSRLKRSRVVTRTIS
nr:hypothetical protein [Sphingomonas chungangi]